jgi:hypothetical protein
MASLIDQRAATGDRDISIPLNRALGPAAPSTIEHRATHIRRGVMTKGSHGSQFLSC